MASLSVPSVSEQNRDDDNNKNNSINKFLLPRKPQGQDNQILSYTRDCAADQLQQEYPTNKELLRTIAYLRNATAVLYEPDKMLPYNKAYIHDEDDDDEEGVTEDDEEHNFLPNDEKGNQEIDKSMQKPNKNLTRKQGKNSSHADKIIIWLAIPPEPVWVLMELSL
ncbi:hypothetical protein PIB30_003131 [Stylosanthes scabra]|uniref:Uncharacterized protein n=1 Tax=Stylosanthes scabra TaxID=79078 RepID=A0ABU6Y1J1_9FABA|nr:hypothetical protein [Stylosanthes scabra]